MKTVCRKLGVPLLISKCMYGHTNGFFTLTKPGGGVGFSDSSIGAQTTLLVVSCNDPCIILQIPYELINHNNRLFVLLHITQ